MVTEQCLTVVTKTFKPIIPQGGVSFDNLTRLTFNYLFHLKKSFKK